VISSTFGRASTTGAAPAPSCASAPRQRTIANALTPAASSSAKLRQRRVWVRGSGCITTRSYHPSMHPAALPIDVLLKEVEYRTTRGPGPGGQHRNKSDTMARLTHRPTGIHAQAGERRSLDLNRTEAIHRLRLNLALRHRTPSPAQSAAAADYTPSALWRSRLRGTKFVVSADHDDFPALLAEALDLLSWLDDDVPAAARTLGVSTSQFVRFLDREPAALAELNQRRTTRGKPPLR
jgi:RF-1 domain